MLFRSCQNNFCKDHRQTKDHKCKGLDINIKSKKKLKSKNKIMKCTKCKHKIEYPLSSKCSLCYENFCETHRLPEYHVCQTLSKTCREEELSMKYIKKTFPYLF